MKPMRMAVVLVMTGFVVVCGVAQVKDLNSEIIPEVKPLDLPLVDPKTVPENATYWMATHMATDTGAPYPWNPLASLDVPVYWLQGRSYLVDDRVVGSIDKALLAMHLLELAAQGKLLDEEVVGLRSSGPPPPSINTNTLWLELLDDEFTNGIALLKLHNTLDTAYAGYQLMIRTNDFSVPNDWILGEIISGAATTNVTDFAPFPIPVPLETNAQMYFRAHYADAIISISTQTPMAYEPNGIGSGQAGVFRVYLQGTNDITALYRVSGTATGGVDYSNLTGSVTIPVATGYADIRVTPIPDTVVEGSETVTLTLIQTNAYLIPSNAFTATVEILDSSTELSVSAPAPEAIEPNGPPGVAAQPGSFALSRTDALGLYPALRVYYTVTGTASNGVDYSLLSGTLDFAVDSSTTNLDVNPLSDNLGEGIESVTVNLIPTTNYSVAGNAATGTVTIADSSTTVSLIPWANATEPNGSTNQPGQNGLFVLSRFDTRNEYPTNLTVYYAVSGTASNGLDYTNLTGSVSFGTNPFALLFVEPMADALFEGDESVTLTLLATNGYLVDPNTISESIVIIDSLPTNVFIPVVLNLTGPIGIDYHAPSNSLIVSYNYSSGTPLNFAQIYTNLVVSNSVVITNTIVTNWSRVQGVTEEVKLATVKTNASGFTNGDLYFGSNTGIGWLAADGTRSNLNWCVLTNTVVTNTMLLRGSVYVDQTGVFSNQVIAVTSVTPDGSPEDPKKGVWRVDAQAHPTLVAQIPTTHLEGVVTLPNDVTRWGPWAGKIITGDEIAHAIYAVATNGVFTTNYLGIDPEDFDIIPPNQNLYACDYENNRIVKLPASYLTNYVGDLLITQAGEPFNPRLFVVHWDTTITNFVTRVIPYNSHFEHVSFAPIDLPPR